jgi:hypothetical protein
VRKEKNHGAQTFYCFSETDSEDCNQLGVMFGIVSRHIPTIRPGSFGLPGLLYSEKRGYHTVHFANIQPQMA